MQPKGNVNFYKNSSPTAKLLHQVILLAWFLAMAGCTQDNFAIRPKPGGGGCTEAVLGLSKDPKDKLEGIVERPVSLELLREYMHRPANMDAALSYKKHILHYFRRLESFDEEIVPVKFPLYWELDTTHVQTEGTYLIEFKSASEVKIDFHCDACFVVDIHGQRQPATRSNFTTSFTAGTNGVQETADWSFKLRPRKIQLVEEVGKKYIVQVESRTSYGADAKSRMQLEDVGYGYILRFSDPLASRSEDVMKGLAIAMVNDDRWQRQQAIDKVIDPLRPQIDSLYAVVDSLKSLLVLDGKSGAIHAALAPAEERLLDLLTQKSTWDIKRAAFLPRFLVLSPGIPCGKMNHK